jgi:hypothetical protein
MAPKALLTIAAMTLLPLSAARADTVGSAPAFGNGQTAAVCYFSNIGTNTITFSFVEIRKEFQPTIPLVTNNCSSLVGLASCRAVANLGPGEAGVAHWCVAEVNNKKFLRGRLEIRGGSTVLSSEEIR